MTTKTLPCALAAWLIALLDASAALAGAHTWDVNELFSNADGTIQFIELKNTAAPSEFGLTSQTIASNGSSLIPGGSIGGSTADKHYLIATQSFADLPGAPTPDRIINPITPGENIPFFDIDGDSVSYGPYDTLTFGSGVLPTDGVNSLDRTLATAVNSPTNYNNESGSVDAGGGSNELPLLSGHVIAMLAATIALLGGAAAVRRRRIVA